MIERSAPTRSKGFAPERGVSASRLERPRMMRTMTTSPKNTNRHDAKVVTAPPSKGPIATAMAPAAATMP